MVALLLIFSLSFSFQEDSCRLDTRVRDDSVEIPRFKKIIQSSRFENYFYNELTANYYEFYGTWLSTIQKIASQDSLLVIHSFDNKRMISKSLVINFDRQEILGLKYDGEKIHICRLDSFSIFLAKMFQTRDHFLNPYLGVTVDNSSHNYILEMSIADKRRSYLVCIEGLPRDYFEENTFDIKKGTEWYFAQELFESF